jgi:hypothetical protein
MTCLLKAGLTQPGKLVAGEQRSKHDFVATEAGATLEILLEKKYAVIKELLEAVFSMPSDPRPHTEDRNGAAISI